MKCLLYKRPTEFSPLFVGPGEDLAYRSPGLLAGFVRGVPGRRVPRARGVYHAHVEAEVRMTGAEIFEAYRRHVADSVAEGVEPLLISQFMRREKIGFDEPKKDDDGQLSLNQSDEVKS